MFRQDTLCCLVIHVCVPPRPSAGPGFPGYPQPPDATAPPTSTGPTLYTPSQPPQATTPQQSTVQSQTTSFTGSTSKLSELKPTYSFTASALDSDSETDEGLVIAPLGSEPPEGDPSEVVRSKVEEVETLEGGSPRKEVEDIRHRRLQRFNSVPQTGSLIEGGGVSRSEKGVASGETKNTSSND